MAEEKLRRIDAAVALGGETEMEEPDLVSEVDVVSQNCETGNESSEHDEDSDQSEDDQGNEEEPASWAGRIPLSQSLSLWRESRAKERYVVLCPKLVVRSCDLLMFLKVLSSKHGVM